MAPTLITDDFYMVLEVEQNATIELISLSYKRLARKLHPDKNNRHDATESFQLLGRAYETLKDESKRRAYDSIYPSIKPSRPSTRTTQTSSSSSEALSETAQIAALQKSKQDRKARWWTKKNAFDSLIFEMKRNVQQLEQEIKFLDKIIAAEAAKEAQKNSWGAWLLSPIYKQKEDSEEEKARKDIARQERKIQKDMKERRLGIKKVDLKKEENLLRKAQDEVDTADISDDSKIQVIRDRILAREFRERQEKERLERERVAKLRKQQQEQWVKQQQEMAEALRKKRAQELAAAQKREEENARLRQKFCNMYAEENTYQPFKVDCVHDGWWSKVQGRTACPKCHDSWTYLLQCPGCNMKACPKCQSTIRPRNRRSAPRMQTRTEDYFDDFF